ncbi:MAG: hypothetical protein EXS36_18905 [Pedosphaera sp.]|nr:hypothetical protein [Pedosphaera sp.]
MTVNPVPNFIALLALLLATGFATHAAEEHPRVKLWQKFEPCTVVTTEYGDGDSFRVKLPNGDEQVFRLTWVDCPESDSRIPTRNAEQAAHFGVSTNDIPGAGKEAKKVCQQLLSKPFTVRTRWASAMGMSRKPRYYAFIVTSDGRDIGEELLRLGWARVKGQAMNHPDGTPRDEYRQRLDGIEKNAKANRRGLWAKSKPAKP